MREPWQDARTLREWDERCVRDAVREAGVDEAEVRRLFREWDLELLDDLELAGVTVTAPHIDPLDLLTVAQVAAILKRHRRTVERDIAAGRLKAVRLGRFLRVPRAELARYIEEAAGE